MEYGFKQVKNELGWADVRLTEYGSIERWWETIFSAYLMVTLQADYFQSCLESPESSSQGASGAILECFGQHPWWESRSELEECAQQLTSNHSALSLLLLACPLVGGIFYSRIEAWFLPIDDAHELFSRFS
jgi:hypothetical protein